MDFIEMLLSSSSSSDDDDSDTEIVFRKFDPRFEPSAQEKKVRIINFVADYVDYYSDEQFRQQFRLKKGTAEFIIEKYKSSAYGHTNEGIGRRGMAPKNQILAFLWFCANKNSYREVGNLFNMSESTFCNHLGPILDFFYDISKQFIKFPETEDAKERMAENFKKISKFENVLGCIDGTYIPIRKPAKKIRTTYINRHDMLSMTVQGVCDPDKRFLDICVGSPSKIHDSRIFSLSPLSDDLPQICQQKFHLLGDAAYPIREYLLTPFRNDSRMTQKRRKYNLKHAQTRVLIENAFGLLKTRFRQLMRLDFFTVDRTCKFVMACCVLHNICINMNDYIEVDEELTHDEDNLARENDADAPINPGIRNAALRRLGEIKRDNIADSFQ